MIALPNVGYAIFCRDLDAFWSERSGWVAAIKEGQVFRSPSGWDALDRCNVKLLQLAAEGHEVFAVVVPTGDYW